MRQAIVQVNEEKAGLLSETPEGYFCFQYDPEYLKQPQSTPISLTMPLREEPYESKTMFPFFDGLIPEGYLLNIAVDNWKLNRRDRMGLLLKCCKDCVGAVSILELPEKEID